MPPPSPPTPDPRGGYPGGFGPPPVGAVGEIPGPSLADFEHLRWLSIGFYVYGGLITLCSFFPIFHFLFGMYMLIMAPGSPSGRMEARAAGGFFAVVALTIILLGVSLGCAMLYAGKCLSQYRSHTFCFVMAVIACINPPLGTALGVFTIIVLVRPQVKAMFSQSAA